jgi:hypothetical protein
LDQSLFGGVGAQPALQHAPVVVGNIERGKRRHAGLLPRGDTLTTTANHIDIISTGKH